MGSFNIQRDILFFRTAAQAGDGIANGLKQRFAKVSESAAQNKALYIEYPVNIIVKRAKQPGDAFQKFRGKTVARMVSLCQHMAVYSAMLFC